VHTRVRGWSAASAGGLRSAGPCTRGSVHTRVRARAGPGWSAASAGGLRSAASAGALRSAGPCRRGAVHARVRARAGPGLVSGVGRRPEVSGSVHARVRGTCDQARSTRCTRGRARAGPGLVSGVGRRPEVIGSDSSRRGVGWRNRHIPLPADWKLLFNYLMRVRARGMENAMVYRWIAVTGDQPIRSRPGQPFDADLPSGHVRFAGSVTRGAAAPARRTAVGARRPFRGRSRRCSWH
jgi:hypothetical protein